MRTEDFIVGFCGEGVSILWEWVKTVAYMVFVLAGAGVLLYILLYVAYLSQQYG